MVSDFLTNFGAGAFVGFTLGFTLKRFFNLFVFLLGLYILSLLFLQSKGIINIHPEALAGWVKGLFQSFGDFIRGIVAPVSSLTGFAVGFAVGWRT